MVSKPVDLGNHFQKDRIMNKTLNDLKSRYQSYTGHSMPLDIQRLPLERIVRAVELVEAGNTVFVPKSVTVEEEPADSMLAWDKHGEHS